MSQARCTSCHCFSRLCPEGFPNHKTVSTVGPLCTMNSLGRHYRDQTDTSQPTCDYENCTFFTSQSEYSDLPYPTDISTGPASDPSPPAQQGADLSLILQMLQQQKADSERTNAQMRQTNEQMANLQSQVSSLLLNPVTSSSVHTSPPIFSSTTTAPNVVTSAAASLTSALQAGLGHQSNYGYGGLTIDQLRANPAIATEAAAVLDNATRQVPHSTHSLAWAQLLGYSTTIR